MLKKLGFLLVGAEKKKLLILFFCMSFLAFLETFGIGIIIPIMNFVVDKEKIFASKSFQWFSNLTNIRETTIFITTLIIIAIVLFFVKTFYAVFMLYEQKAVVNNIRVRITNKLLTSYLNRPYLFHLESNTAILFRNITAAVSDFSSAFLYSLVEIGSDLMVLLGISCLLIWVYPVVTILFCGILAVTLITINFFLKKRIKAYSLQRLESSSQVHKYGLETLHAVKEIKAYNAQAFFIEQFSKATKKYSDCLVKFAVASGLPRYILDLILCTSILTALLASVYFYNVYTELIPTMTVLGFAAIRILPTVYRIYSNVNTIRYYKNSFGIVYEALKEKGSEKIPEKSISKSPEISSEPQPIRLENVKFRYSRTSSPIFEEFNLVIPKHKTVAFAGKTGTGKSTLIDIIMGLLPPQSGVLYYGETPVTSQNVMEYRKKIGYIPQQTFLIDDTLKANIAFGIPRNKVDYDQLKHAVRVSQLEFFVNSLPSGAETVIGERGVRLSGGQRQRVAIARALYRNPEILIMDEATSSLDGYTESEIDKAVRSLGGKLTIIIIAHRLSTIEHADIIYVMDSGKIVDQGTFRELYENSIAFKKLTNQTIT